MCVLIEISKGAQWSGRNCCGLALSPRCQNTCAVATSRNDLRSSCRESDEQNFYTCLSRQEFGEECCSNSRSSECHHVIIEMIFSVYNLINVFYTFSGL